MSSGLMISSIRSHPEVWPLSAPISTRNEILPSASGLIVTDASTIPGTVKFTILPPSRPERGAVAVPPWGVGRHRKPVSPGANSKRRSDVDPPVLPRALQDALAHLENLLAGERRCVGQQEFRQLLAELVS